MSDGQVGTSSDRDAVVDPVEQAEAGTTSFCEIRLGSRLDALWAGWFDGMSLVPLPDGTTRLAGAVQDQAAVHGLIRRIGDLGIDLVSVSVTVR